MNRDPLASEESEIIALALSGGGFRATLFHLGVIRYLRETERLKKVKYICSVSGGSILAAHLVLCWDKFEGNPEQFNNAAQRVIALVREDVRGRVLRGWLFWRCFPLIVIPTICWIATTIYPTWSLYLSLAAGVSLLWGAGSLLWNGRSLRTRLLADVYDRTLFRSATLCKLHDPGPKPDCQKPSLYLLNTNLTTGDLCAFTETGFSWWKRNAEVPTLFPQLLPVALAVAASSAFPPAFPPVRLTRKDLRADADAYPSTQYLTDGGVYDNLAIKGLRKVIPSNTTIEVMVSDAERRFDSVEDQWLRFRFVVPRAQRAGDIVMNRVTEYQNREEEERTSPPLFIRLRKEVDGVPHPIPQLIRNIRTDLDRFSLAEIQLLVYQGYVIARQSFTEESGLPEGIALLRRHEIRS